MVSLFRQDATGGYSKELYLIGREEIVTETVIADVVLCPKCSSFAEIKMDDRGKARPCSECGASLRTIIKGIELDRIYWR